jgi:hypothetical protein
VRRADLRISAAELGGEDRAGFGQSSGALERDEVRLIRFGIPKSGRL